MSTVFDPVVVQSAHGHTFMGTDVPEHKSCLICGAMFELVDRGDGVGIYTAANGDPADECSRDTGRVHAYPGEGWCDAKECREAMPGKHDAIRSAECPHIPENHTCNCLFCH